MASDKRTFSTIKSEDDSSTIIDFDQTCLTIKAMIKQERKIYSIPDYLPGDPAFNDSEQMSVVDKKIRFQVAQWTLQLAKACDYSVETSCLAMSCLDRFLSTIEGDVVIRDPAEYQKAALTSLYIAVKMNEFEVLSPQNIAMLSRGKHTAKDVEEMEMNILNSLGWRVNPPTASFFVQLYLQLIPNFCSNYGDRILLDVADSQIKQSILDYDLCLVPTSMVAFASIMNAIAIIYRDKKLCTTMKKLIGAVTDIDFETLKEVQKALFESIPEEELDQCKRSGEKEEAPEEDVPESEESIQFENTRSLKSKTYANSPRSMQEQL